MGVALHVQHTTRNLYTGGDGTIPWPPGFHEPLRPGPKLYGMLGGQTRQLWGDHICMTLGGQNAVWPETPDSRGACVRRKQPSPSPPPDLCPSPQPAPSKRCRPGRRGRTPLGAPCAGRRSPARRRAGGWRRSSPAGRRGPCSSSRAPPGRRWTRTPSSLKRRASLAVGVACSRAVCCVQMGTGVYLY